MSLTFHQLYSAFPEELQNLLQQIQEIKKNFEDVERKFITKLTKWKTTSDEMEQTKKDLLNVLENNGVNQYILSWLFSDQGLTEIWE